MIPADRPALGGRHGGEDAAREVEPAGNETGAPLILTIGLAKADQLRFERLRRAHFPPERNLIAAHVTMFHHLPGREMEAVRHCVQVACAGQPPMAMQVTGLRSLGRGVAFALHSPPMSLLRSRLAQAWHGSLTAQDRQAWRPHVTIQNKVSPAAAAALLAELQSSFVPFEVRAEGLLLWRYLGGPWESLGTFPFTA